MRFRRQFIWPQRARAYWYLEQNAQPGGKMSEMTAAGFRWDTGPSVITMRPVFEALFARAGRRLEDYLTLRPLSPLTRYFYPDGSVLDIDADPNVTAQRLAHYDRRDGKGYLRFLDYAQKDPRNHKRRVHLWTAAHTGRTDQEQPVAHDARRSLAHYARGD